MANTTNSKSISRRDFIKTLWVGLGSVATLELGGMTLAYMQPRQTEGEFGSVIIAGKVDDFPRGSVTPFPNGRFYLTRLEDGGFLAIYHRCTHLGCSVPWDQSRALFICPCHNSQFTSTGEVINPPAPRALDLFQVTIEDNQVKVNTGKVIQRDHFEPAQVVYA
ncbi:MAG: ubiquinol-cytochrome c reductase iron-sulfur subunit [Anaerolineales bacterium]